MRHLLIAVAVVIAGCGPVEIRIDETKGVPSLKGTTEVSIATNFTCGQSLPAGDKMVTTRVVTGGCEFTFDDSIEVLKPSDYEGIPELKTASNLVQRVELSVNKLDFVDGTSGAKLDLQTRVTSAVLSVNGQQVADKAALARLPLVVKLEGAALTALKSKVDARQTASVGVKAVAVLPDTPAPPAKLKIDYDAQPAIIIGPGSLF
ncbi:MAG: hypothetical protein QM817_39830 [Archangium sp.]